MRLIAFLLLAAALPGQDLEKRRDEIAARLEGLRALKFKAPLKVREGTRGEYRAFALENARRVYGGDLKAAEKGLKAMGLIPSLLRIDLAITAHAGIGVKAWCTGGELLLLDLQAGDDWLLNKMDLGLIDQHFAPRAAPTFDGQMALAALRMGDAEIVKHLFWHAGRLPDGHVQKLARDAAAWEKGESRFASAIAPRLFVRSADFPWRRGAAFAGSLVAVGGLPRLDRAYAEPPVSTEQVLHPEKYLAAEKPSEIDLTAADGFLAARGYKPVFRTVLGELGAAIVLETHFPAEDLAAASEGWSGDTFAVYEKEDAPPLVLWATDWDTGDDAAQFHAQSDRLATKFSPAEAATGAKAARRKGAVILAVNASPELQGALLEAAWRCARKRGDRVEPYGD